MRPHTESVPHGITYSGISSTWERQRWRTALESNLITLVDTQHDNIGYSAAANHHAATEIEVSTGN